MVAGATALDRAVAFAGALAELGVQRATMVRSDGTHVELIARVTDLPGVLVAAGNEWELTCDLVWAKCESGAIAWTARDGPAAEALRASLGS